MNRNGILRGCLIVFFVVGFGVSSLRSETPNLPLKSALQQEFRLGGRRTPGTFYFDMVTTLVGIGADGTRGEPETFRVKLRCVSQGDPETAGDRYTCRRFFCGKPGSTTVTIPALDGWTYTFKRTKSGLDEKGQVFGVDQSRFGQLKDSDGSTLAHDKAYAVYNTFIDFHSFCDALGGPTVEGKGIQNLSRIGQRIVHAAANSKPPTSLSGHIREGSYFKNGEITLLLKGLGILGDSPCAVVELDSGDSSFQMLMEPMPGMRIRTLGASHYFGDLYVDLASQRVRQVTLRERIVSETKVPMPGDGKPRMIGSVQERQLLIRAVTKEEYEKDAPP